MTRSLVFDTRSKVWIDPKTKLIRNWEIYDATVSGQTFAATARKYRITTERARQIYLHLERQIRLKRNAYGYGEKS